MWIKRIYNAKQKRTSEDILKGWLISLLNVAVLNVGFDIHDFAIIHQEAHKTFIDEFIQVIFI